MDPFAKKFEPDDPRHYDGNVFMEMEVVGKTEDDFRPKIGRVEIEVNRFEAVFILQ